MLNTRIENENGGQNCRGGSIEVDGWHYATTAVAVLAAVRSSQKRTPSIVRNCPIRAPPLNIVIFTSFSFAFHRWAHWVNVRWSEKQGKTRGGGGKSGSFKDKKVVLLDLLGKLNWMKIKEDTPLFCFAFFRLETFNFAEKASEFAIISQPKKMKWENIWRKLSAIFSS